MDPWLICYLIERKCVLIRNLATILPWKFKFLENFSVLMQLMEVSNKGSFYLVGLNNLIKAVAVWVSQNILTFFILIEISEIKLF